jgi:hypothetical protein
MVSNSVVSSPEHRTPNTEHRTILIIYPHWHPANLAGVHRPRLTGNFLPEFGWKVRVLSVEEQYFEEQADTDFFQTFSDSFELSRVGARKVGKIRLIGDIGLRAYKNLKKKALDILRNEEIDFIWIPIPSFYTALLGPYLFKKTGTPYGVDYIDPWVRDLTNQRNLRAILSQWIARILEPRVLKRVSLITGVSEAYYMPAIERNKLLDRKPTPVRHTAFPYGFDPSDHGIKLTSIMLPWSSENHEPRTTKHEPPVIWLYTGAFLPNSHLFLDALFRSISGLREEREEIRAIQFWFLGTGYYPAKRITAYARDHGIEDQVFEIRERFPYLQTLNIQSAADTIMIIGSTEKHYTASKTYQSLLSKRPVFAMLHQESQALQVLEECKADTYTVRYRDGMEEQELMKQVRATLLSQLEHLPWKPDLRELDKYSARESARKLDAAIRKVNEIR